MRHHLASVSTVQQGDMAGQCQCDILMTTTTRQHNWSVPTWYHDDNDMVTVATTWPDDGTMAMATQWDNVVPRQHGQPGQRGTTALTQHITVHEVISRNFTKSYHLPCPHPSTTTIITRTVKCSSMTPPVPHQRHWQCQPWPVCPDQQQHQKPHHAWLHARYVSFFFICFLTIFTGPLHVHPPLCTTHTPVACDCPWFS